MKEFIKKHNELFFLLVINILFFFIFVESPIYNFSIYGSDSGIYQNIAKEMLNGKVLYRDIFDHKGPFIFFLYLIPALTNVNLGIYVLDAIIYSISCLYMYKTLKLRNISQSTSMLVIILTMLLIVVLHKPLVPESIMFLTVSYMSYWILSKKYLNPSIFDLLFCGILTGIIFWTKYSLGTFIALIYFYFIIKNFKWKNILLPALGFLIVTIPIIGYFIYNNALDALYDAYYLTNIGYSESHLKVIDYVIIFVLMGALLSLSIYYFKQKLSDTGIILIAFLLLSISSFLISGHNMPYYYLPFIFVLSVIPDFNLPYKKYIIIFTCIFAISLAEQGISKTIKEAILQKDYNLFVEDVGGEVNSITSLFTIKTHLQGKLNTINYRYFFFPSLDYNAKPEIWDKIKNDILNKNIEYLIIESEDGMLKVSPGLLPSMDKIEEIMNIIPEHYEKFGTYYDFIVFKAKEVPQN